MDFVATLICDPRSQALQESIVDHAVDLLNKRSCRNVRRHWLGEKIAAELLFAADTLDGSKLLATADLEDAPIDVIVQPAENRKKRILIADMDSTIIEVECLDQLADFAGIKDKISAITERAMRGEIEFEAALHERVQMLEGLDVSALHDTWQSRITLTPGAKALVATMRANGAVTELISGGFTYFTSRVREAVGFDADQANELLIKDGKLTGKVRLPVLGSDAKLRRLERLARENNLSPADIMAVGDGANDIPMLQAAGAGVAFRAKPTTAASVGMSVVHGDLTALLYIQGYAEAEFISD